MSKKINTTAIGLFIVIGVVLGVIGLLLFSSSRLFSRTEEMIVYFDNSLNGLNEGAPVKFRGVTIGSVKRVMIRFNQDPKDFALPVILELDEKLLRKRLGDETVQVFTPRPYSAVFAMACARPCSPRASSPAFFSWGSIFSRMRRRRYSISSRRSMSRCPASRPMFSN